MKEWLEYFLREIICGAISDGIHRQAFGVSPSFCHPS